MTSAVAPITSIHDGNDGFYWPRHLRQSLDVQRILGPWPQEIPGTAQISFYPDVAAYESRRDQTLSQEGLKTSLPQGWPNQVGGPFAWKPADLGSAQDFVVIMNDEEKAEILAALAKVKGLQP